MDRQWMSWPGHQGAGCWTRSQVPTISNKSYTECLWIFPWRERTALICSSRSSFKCRTCKSVFALDFAELFFLTEHAIIDLFASIVFGSSGHNFASPYLKNEANYQIYWTIVSRRSDSSDHKTSIHSQVFRVLCVKSTVNHYLKSLKVYRIWVRCLRYLLKNNIIHFDRKFMNHVGKVISCCLDGQNWSQGRSSTTCWPTGEPGVPIRCWVQTKNVFLKCPDVQNLKVCIPDCASDVSGHELPRLLVRPYWLFCNTFTTTVSSHLGLSRLGSVKNWK